MLMLQFRATLEQSIYSELTSTVKLCCHVNWEGSVCCHTSQIEKKKKKRKKDTKAGISGFLVWLSFPSLSFNPQNKTILFQSLAPKFIRFL